MNSLRPGKSYFLKFLFAAFALCLLFSCSKGVDEAKKAAETARDEVIKSGADKLVPRKYQAGIRKMKVAGKKAEKNDTKKAKELYDIAKTKFLEVAKRAPEKKARLEKNIQTSLEEIKTAKQTAQDNVKSINRKCVEDIVARTLGNSGAGKDYVFQYFDNLMNKAEKKIQNADELTEKASHLNGDATLIEKNSKLKQALNTYNMAGKIAMEICTKTEADAKKIANNNGELPKPAKKEGKLSGKKKNQKNTTPENNPDE
ncbi:MAG: hypothetical protein HZA77_11290 [Candidatus Schekmanbacteria bacterium]|nr:hypothetical protein [Candidatus Schekmanbacteria bacterium]